jgi:hypothetical protein
MMILIHMIFTCSRSDIKIKNYYVRQQYRQDSMDNLIKQKITLVIHNVMTKSIIITHMNI